MEKVDNRRLKNCVNLLTCWQTSYERSNGPFKEMYGETFWRRLISLERTNERETLPTETRISREKRWEDKTSIIRTLLMISFNGISFSFCSLNLPLGSDHQKQYLVWCPSGALVLWNFSLAKMASESAKLTSQNGISTSLWLVGYR